MSDTAKLKAPEGASAISVMGQEYKVIKGIVTVAVEHVAHLVGLGFTSPKGEELTDDTTDPTLPAGVTSNLQLPPPSAEDLARQAQEQQAAAEAAAAAAAAEQAKKEAEEKAAADAAAQAAAEAERAAQEQAAKDAAAAAAAGGAVTQNVAQGQ